MGTSSGNANGNAEPSTTIDSNAKRQIRELTGKHSLYSSARFSIGLDILQGRMREEHPKESEKSEEPQEGTASIMSLLMKPMRFLEQAYVGLCSVEFFASFFVHRIGFMVE